MQTLPVGAELFHARRRADMTMLIFAFRNFCERAWGRSFWYCGRCCVNGWSDPDVSWQRTDTVQGSIGDRTYQLLETRSLCWLETSVSDYPLAQRHARRMEPSVTLLRKA